MGTKRKQKSICNEPISFCTRGVLGKRACYWPTAMMHTGGCLCEKESVAVSQGPAGVSHLAVHNC